MRHQRHQRTGTPRLVVAAIVGLVLGSAATMFGTGQHGTRDAGTEPASRTYGAPPAEVFTDDYAGPPVTGDAVTLLPHLAPLRPGNRTHEVLATVFVAPRRDAAGLPCRRDLSRRDTLQKKEAL